MKPNFSMLFKLFLLQYFSVLRLSDQDFDFYYFVQQWPGSYCDTKHNCCNPKTGKRAADFGIHGLWPNFKNGSYPSNCNPHSVYDKSQISDLVSSLQKDWPALACPSGDGNKFWSHEWVKHGTSSESELNQHDYFEAALKLKEKANLVQILSNAAIIPNDEFYELESIEKAIRDGIGYTPGLQCNKDGSRNTQLYQIYLCVDTSATEFIECPILPRGRCESPVQFPMF